MKLQFCIIASLVSTGIMAGIFFTWTNAVMPGIGRLDDPGFLVAFKSMNKAILNPMFILALFMPVCAIPAAAVFGYAAVDKLHWMLIVAAGLCYIIGCLGITIAGNVPLNERVDAAALETLSVQGLKQLRTAIEMKWNTFNLIRTYASATAFVLLVLSVCLKK